MEHFTDCRGDLAERFTSAIAELCERDTCAECILDEAGLGGLARFNLQQRVDALESMLQLARVVDEQCARLIREAGVANATPVFAGVNAS